MNLDLALSLAETADETVIVAYAGSQVEAGLDAAAADTEKGNPGHSYAGQGPAEGAGGLVGDVPRERIWRCFRKAPVCLEPLDAVDDAVESAMASHAGECQAVRRDRRNPVEAWKMVFVGRYREERS